MPTKDKRVDDYIAKAQPFAQPILKHIRKLVHRAVPQCEETMKWSFPHFDYKGEMMCSMAGFKQHCALTFWKGAVMDDPHKLLDVTRENAMGHFGKLTSVNDLPSDGIMIEYLQQAARLNDEGIKNPARAKSKEPKELTVPDYIVTALKRNKAAQKTFDNFPYSHRKEYVMWLTEAKTEAMREKRLETMLKWLAEGKSRNWKYERKQSST